MRRLSRLNRLPRPLLLPQSVQGVGLMLCAMLLLSIMHAMVRHMGQQLHPFEVTFFRNLFGLIALLPILLRHGLVSLRTRRPGLQILRGCMGFTSMLAWFYSLSVVPIAEATTLSFTAVIFASLGAMLFLGEKIGIRRGVAMLSGFIGVLVVLRPDIHGIDTNALWVIVAAVFWGLAVVVVKTLARTESVVSIVAWMAIMLTAMSIFPALMVWQPPSLVQLIWLMLIGVFATAGHFAMTHALKKADATVLLPLDFTRLVWASVIGYFVFAEIPDRWTWVGAGIIISSVTYIIVRETRLHRNV